MQVIAHRGVPEERPENTLASFALALEQRADGIELDVHRTADDRIVVHHDPVVVDHNGSGAELAIRQHPLRALRASSAVELPELIEVLDLIRGQLHLHVELKGEEVTLPVVELIRRESVKRVSVHAFDHRAVRLAAEVAPEIARGALMVARAVDPVAVLRAAAATTLWQDASLLDADLVEAVHMAGCDVIAWTVNDDAGAARMAAIGVDGICTDRPGRLRQVIEGTAAP